MPAVGTPEPGGLNWAQVTALLRRVGEESRRIVGFDVCELAPAEGPAACAYTAARLVGKLAAYASLRSAPAARPVTTPQWPPPRPRPAPAIIAAGRGWDAMVFRGYAFS